MRPPPSNEARVSRAQARRKACAADVERYYDAWTQRYLEAGDSLIEACRPARTEDLLSYYIASIGLRAGQHLLDAGCGVCGPAVFFATQLPVTIEALTISQVQVDIAKRLIAEAGVEGRVSVRKGDYARLAELYPPASFDGVMFLEALGHAERPEQVIKNAWAVLKPGGFLYIKDFFARETDDPDGQSRVARVVRNIDEHYAYNTLDLHQLLRAARKIGFKIGVIKSPAFDIDIRVRALFESRNGIDIFATLPEFIPTDWLELTFIKDEQYNVNFSPRLDG
jgi:2-polyprenyl-3-methyl-5-hydroxy-6-metoxy-1,4-benzoquinol methylase